MKLLSCALHLLFTLLHLGFLFSNLFLTYLPSERTSHHLSDICHFCCARCTSQWQSNHSLFQLDFFIYCFCILPSTGPTSSTSSRPMGIKHDILYLNLHTRLLDFKYKMLAVPLAVFAFQQGVWVISSRGGLRNQ